MVKRKINFYMVDEPVDYSGLVEVLAEDFLKEHRAKALCKDGDDGEDCLKKKEVSVCKES